MKWKNQTEAEIARGGLPASDISEFDQPTPSKSQSTFVDSDQRSVVVTCSVVSVGSNNLTESQTQARPDIDMAKNSNVQLLDKEHSLPLYLEKNSTSMSKDDSKTEELSNHLHFEQTDSPQLNKQGSQTSQHQAEQQDSELPPAICSHEPSVDQSDIKLSLQEQIAQLASKHPCFRIPRPRIPVFSGDSLLNRVHARNHHSTSLAPTIKHEHDELTSTSSEQLSANSDCVCQFPLHPVREQLMDNDFDITPTSSSKIICQGSVYTYESKEPRTSLNNQQSASILGANHHTQRSLKLESGAAHWFGQDTVKITALAADIGENDIPLDDIGGLCMPSMAWNYQHGRLHGSKYAQNGYHAALSPLVQGSSPELEETITDPKLSHIGRSRDLSLLVSESSSQSACQNTVNCHSIESTAKESWDMTSASQLGVCAVRTPTSSDYQVAPQATGDSNAAVLTASCCGHIKLQDSANQGDYDMADAEVDTSDDNDENYREPNLHRYDKHKNGYEMKINGNGSTDKEPIFGWTHSYLTNESPYYSVALNQNVEVARPGTPVIDHPAFASHEAALDYDNVQYMLSKDVCSIDEHDYDEATDLDGRELSENIQNDHHNSKPSLGRVNTRVSRRVAHYQHDNTQVHGVSLENSSIRSHCELTRDFSANSRDKELSNCMLPLLEGSESSDVGGRHSLHVSMSMNQTRSSRSPTHASDSGAETGDSPDVCRAVSKEGTRQRPVVLRQSDDMRPDHMLGRPQRRQYRLRVCSHGDYLVSAHSTPDLRCDFNYQQRNMRHRQESHPTLGAMLESEQFQDVHLQPSPPLSPVVYQEQLTKRSKQLNGEHCTSPSTTVT